MPVRPSCGMNGVAVQIICEINTQANVDRITHMHITANVVLTLKLL